MALESNFKKVYGCEETHKFCIVYQIMWYTKRIRSITSNRICDKDFITSNRYHVDLIVYGNSGVIFSTVH